MAGSKKIIGQKIKHLREKRGLSQQELADKLETDRQYISKIENGKINMSLDYLDKIIKALKCKPADFYPPLEGVSAFGGRGRKK